jgi:hypothetical protein
MNSMHVSIFYNRMRRRARLGFLLRVAFVHNYYT